MFSLDDYSWYKRQPEQPQDKNDALRAEITRLRADLVRARQERDDALARLASERLVAYALPRPKLTAYERTLEAIRDLRGLSADQMRGLAEPALRGAP